MEKDNTIFQTPSATTGQLYDQGQPLSVSSSVAQPAAPGSLDKTQPDFTQSNLASSVAQAQQSQSFVSEASSTPPKGKRSRGIKKLLSLLLSVFIILGLFVVIAVIFFPNSNSGTSGEVTLTYWGLFKDTNVMQEVITDFERQNPNIKIKYEKQDINQYRDRLTARIANGTGPDIFRFHNTWYPMLKDTLLPLPSDTISPEVFKSIYYPVMQKDLIKNGAIYGIPLEIDTLALYINTQLFQSAGINPPTNWVDFVNAARLITVKDADGKIKTAGAAMGTYANISHAPDILSLLFLENGVDFNNLEASTQRIADTLTFYSSFAKDTNNVWDNTLDPSQLAFSKGNLGMYFGYSTDYFAIKQFNPSLTFQIVPVPQLPEQNVTLASYWVEGASIKGKHQKESLLFLRFLAKKETEQKLYALESKAKEFGVPYARVDLAEDLKNNSFVYPFVLQAPSAMSSYFVDETYDNGFNQQLNSHLEAAVNAYLGTGSTSKSTLEAFKNGVTQTSQKYNQ